MPFVQGPVPLLKKDYRGGDRRCEGRVGEGVDEAQNRKVLEYFKDRRVWLLEASHDHSPLKLVLYPSRSAPDLAFHGG
jgi:hypothetical protein